MNIDSENLEILFQLIIFFVGVIFIFGLIIHTIDLFAKRKKLKKSLESPFLSEINSQVIETKNIVLQTGDEVTGNFPDRKNLKKKAIVLVLLWMLVFISIPASIFLLPHKEPITIPELIMNLETDKRDETLSSLGKLGAPAIGPLIQAYQDTDDWYLRAAIADTLKLVRDKNAVEPLIVGLQHTDPFVRSGVAEALGWIGSNDAVEPLIAVLDDKYEMVQIASAEALERIGNERAVEPLIGLINDWTPDVRVAIVHALISLGDKRAEEPILSAIEKGDSAVIASQPKYFIARAKPGDEHEFIAALNYYGSKEMAEVYLNCGNSELQEAALAWAKKNGYEITGAPSYYSAVGYGSNR
jgi:hypothetical protein